MTTTAPSTATSSKKAKKKVKPTSQIHISVVAGAGSPFKEGDLDIIVPALEKHIEKYGKIDTKVLYDEIESDVAHPMRRFLDWDDAAAAKKFRLTQITKIIRFIRFRVETGGRVIEPRAYQNVVVKDELPNTAPGRAYVRTSTIVQHDTLSKQILERAAKELRQWQERYSMHTQFTSVFAPVFNAIESFEKNIANTT